jgi:hypothetical protein
MNFLDLTMRQNMSLNHDLLPKMPRFMNVLVISSPSLNIVIFIAQTCQHLRDKDAS